MNGVGSRLLPTGTALLPGRARQVALVVAALGLFVTVGLGVHYRRGDRAGWLDLAVGHPLAAGSPRWHTPLWTVVTLGDPLIFVTLCGCVVLGVVLAGAWEALPLVVLAPLGSTGIAEFVLKPAVGRTMSIGWCYPSGHTTGVTSLATVLIVLLARSRRPESVIMRASLAVLVLTIPVAMAAALVALRLHYLTDTIGGGCLALSVTLALALLMDWIASAQRTGSRAGSVSSTP